MLIKLWDNLWVDALSIDSVRASTDPECTLVTVRGVEHIVPLPLDEVLRICRGIDWQAQWWELAQAAFVKGELWRRREEHPELFQAYERARKGEWGDVDVKVLTRGLCRLLNAQEPE